MKVSCPEKSFIMNQEGDGQGSFQLQSGSSTFQLLSLLQSVSHLATEALRPPPPSLRALLLQPLLSHLDRPRTFSAGPDN